MTLIRDDRLHVDDLTALMKLVGRRFAPARLAGGLLQRLNPLAAAWVSIPLRSRAIV